MAARKKGKGRRTSARTAGSSAAGSTAASIVSIGQQIWLAGLGAFARAQSEGPKLFEALVQEGSEIQERQRESAQRFMKETWDDLRGAIDSRTEGLRGRANETFENLEKIFQARVQKALQQLGMPTSQEINALSRKVNELNHSVQALTGKPRRTPASRRTRTTHAEQSAAA